MSQNLSLFLLLQMTYLAPTKIIELPFFESLGSPSTHTSQNARTLNESLPAHLPCCASHHLHVKSFSIRTKPTARCRTDLYSSHCLSQLLSPSATINLHWSSSLSPPLNLCLMFLSYLCSHFSLLTRGTEALKPALPK